MTPGTAAIHASAVIDPGAEIGPGTSVGPYSVVGPEVRVGANNRIDAHVIIDGRVTLGDDNKIFPFTLIGLPPQDLKYGGEPTEVVIGSRNTFREYSQVHRGTAGGGGVTRVGSDGFFMVSTHIAHDCVVGDRVLFANAGTLGGHVRIEDDATVG
ncbi:MAG: acyl-[acyl-carrier-protein]--UDP-N-acetylglucosamine O-acyltransferase, partial [Acidobacteriota bacterium]|nr:acyl-[acyl-carrier-protein]--UDP-N-acetylglucosamine O-acyltransferase [Acidobacteriota bacterium]